MGRGFHKGLICAALLASAAAVAAPDPQLTVQRERLAAAKAAADRAAIRSAELERAAAGERDAAARARAEEAVVAARVARAEADLTAARARVAVVEGMLAGQRDTLASHEAPVARLLAALQSLATRPALVSIAQPGSVDDLVHVRAVLGGALPVVRARTAGLRAGLDRTRALRGDALLAATALHDSRQRLDTQHRALAALEAQHRARSVAFDRSALDESDRAIAMGERARDIVDQLAASGSDRATLAELAGLPGPPAPVEHDHATANPPAYHLPVAGSVATGFGEMSPAGVRSRGLSMTVSPGAVVRAPAAGRIVFARVFRGYRTIVILDHGAGWTTLVTGLAAAGVAPGQVIAAGAPIGRAPPGDDPQITVELRRMGRPIDIAALL